MFLSVSSFSGFGAESENLRTMSSLAVQLSALEGSVKGKDSI